MGVVRPLVKASSHGATAVHAANTATKRWVQGLDVHLRGADEVLKSLKL